MMLGRAAGSRSDLDLVAFSKYIQVSALAKAKSTNHIDLTYDWQA